MNGIVVIAELFLNDIQPVTYELIEAALRIKKIKNRGQIKIIVPSENPLPLAEKLSEKCNAADIAALKINNLKCYDSEMYKPYLAEFIRSINPTHILVAHTSQGRDFAPGLALRLNASSIAGVNGIRADDKGFLYSKPVRGNTKNMIVRAAADLPAFLTVMPGVFTPENCNRPGRGEVTIHETVFHNTHHRKNRIQSDKIIKKNHEHKSIKEAKIIISAGKGVGNREKLDSVFKFASCFSSSFVGASRPLVDMGWIGHEHQIGITGTTVLPELYIACGISGSSQHLAGMKDSKFVISINSNPDAHIFNHSDICIVEDADQFITAFLKKVGHNNNLKGKL